MSLRIGALLALAAAAALLLACGGGGDGILIGDEGSPTPTATAPIFPTPGAGTPRTSPGVVIPTATPAATPAGGVVVTPVAEPFEITVDEATNVRDRPSTGGESTVLAIIFPGGRAMVLGEASGEEAEPGEGDLWYQVELTQEGTTVVGFVYAPLVERVEE